MSNVVYLCMPAYGATPEAVSAFWLAAFTSSKCTPMPVLPGAGSLLAHSFNKYWCSALNLQTAFDMGWRARLLGTQHKNPFPHTAGDYMHEAWNSGWNMKEGERVARFAMLHGDVFPAKGFLDQLYSDLEESGADVMAAVVPFKDPTGRTSTAEENPADEYDARRRLTMKEIARLPEIFGAAEAGFPDRALLANTGCWMARLDRPWCRAKNPDKTYKVLFTIRDQIREDKDGMLSAAVSSEDWNFSRAVQAEGGKVMCTRRIDLVHQGRLNYANNNTSGGLETDGDPE